MRLKILSYVKISGFLFIFFTPLLFIGLFANREVFAQDDFQYDTSQAQKTYEGVVRNVIEESKNEGGGYYQKLEVEIVNKDLQGQIFIVEYGLEGSLIFQKYKVGDGLVLTGYQEEGGGVTLFVSDYIRRGSLLSLFIIFLAVSVVVAGKRGISSFVGMIITFVIIFWMVLPMIGSGASPLLTVVLFSIIAIPVTFYLSHGVNKKTSVAVAGTFSALLITLVMSSLYVNASKLTGYTTDEASFLQIAKGGSFNMKGILLAGIIIGVLGVLDDITVSQSAIVFQLKNANKRLTFSELFKRSMDVGKDHIASMVNTLILVYAGASLPLLLLFTDSGHTFSEVINYEIIASEIVRTLIGSIGLVLAVPITTFIASLAVDSNRVESN